MTQIRAERVAAVTNEEFVVFLIGMRINKLWKVHKWLPVANAMGRMLKELNENPELGFLGVESGFGRTTIMMQYWRSFEHLENYAKDKSREHLPAWAAFNKAVASNGDVGIWHETYRVRPGDYECVYNNMPPFGLGNAMQLVPAMDLRNTAAGRMNQAPQKKAA
ncbi:MAG: DUF4188 domain-containing protein [Pseudomonadota bacterium]